MHRSLLLLGLAMGGPAVAADGDTAVLDDSGELPAAEPADDALWSWLDRLDGEQPTPEMLEAADEATAAELEEMAFIRRIHGLDVPDDYYRDPHRVLRGDPLYLAKVDPREFDIPMVVNDHVEQWVRYFVGPGRKYFHRWLQRKSAFEPLIQRELAAAGLPRDLIYLSMIESGFNTHAYSHADAAGLWQFIPSTARMYGLTVDYWRDDRRDPELATKASLRFLSELYRTFGDWQLAWAAYNTGPARVRRALQAAGEGADFWTLVERNLLHPETKGYVPKILAAAIIGHHPERYGFTDVVPEPEFVYDTVVIEDAVDLVVLAECAGITVDELRWYNPALRRSTLPKGRVELRIPPGTADAFREAYAKVPPDQRVRLVLHVVAKGETLSMVASRYGVSTAELVRANNLSNPNRLYVGQKLMVPVAGRSAPTPERPEKAPASKPAETKTAKVETVAKAEAPTTKPEPTRAEPAQADVVQRYTVRAGDTLSQIAQRFGVATADLQAWNRIRDPRSLYAGQVLEIRSGNAPAAPASAPATYTVQPGDALSVIAARHGVRLADLMAWNGLEDASRIRVGQVLKLRPPAEGIWITHRVKSGESLGIIAARYGVTVADLRAWNKITGSTIYAGDELKIRK